MKSFEVWFARTADVPALQKALGRVQRLVPIEKSEWLVFSRQDDVHPPDEEILDGRLARRLLRAMEPSRA